MHLAEEWFQIRRLIEVAGEYLPFKSPEEDAEARLEAADRAPGPGTCWDEHQPIPAQIPS